MKRVRNWVVGTCGFAAVVFLVVGALQTTTHATDSQRSYQKMLTGKGLYLRYCSACHGIDGRGDGTVAPYLKPKPTNLTLLAKNNDGNFPLSRILDVVDGTTAVRAHGESAMPVWGEVFLPNPKAPVEQQIDARGRLLLITEYLRSIQVK